MRAARELDRARTAGDFAPLNLGRYCPFCGKPWSYQGYCGDRPPGAPGNWKEQNAAGLLFPGRRGRVAVVVRVLRECPTCRGVFEASPKQVYCSVKCRDRAYVERNIETIRAAYRVRTARYRAKKAREADADA